MEVSNIASQGEVKAGRLRTLLKQAEMVKSREELVDYAMGKFMVTRRTADDYVDDVISYYKQHPELLK